MAAEEMQWMVGGGGATTVLMTTTKNSINKCVVAKVE